jgi:hypothetical protein
MSLNSEVQAKLKKFGAAAYKYDKEINEIVNYLSRYFTNEAMFDR